MSSLISSLFITSLPHDMPGVSFLLSSFTRKRICAKHTKISFSLHISRCSRWAASPSSIVCFFMLVIQRFVTHRRQWLVECMMHRHYTKQLTRLVGCLHLTINVVS